MKTSEFFASYGFKLIRGFGPRTNPITHKPDLHRGQDFGGPPAGTPVPTPTWGVVTHSKRYAGYGNLVAIKDAKNFYHLFAHLDSRSVQIGASVYRGDIIGKLGSTGKSTGPHLHYQINKSGINGSDFWGDPEEYLYQEDTMEIILLNTQFDATAGFWLQPITGAAIAVRGPAVYKLLLPKARTVYVVGGDLESVQQLAPQAKIIHLSGSNQRETMKAVLHYLDSKK